MAYYTEAEARAAFERSQQGRPIRRSAAQVLNEEVAAVRDADRFDVFLSHCVKDADVIRGVKALLEAEGLRVYVDWDVDRQLNRAAVTPGTAALLRRRMQASDSMMFATSTNSSDSKWMPWELGYFDGLRQGRIAIFPLVRTGGEGFQGQEYLGLYPVVERLLHNQRSKPYVTRGRGVQAYQELSSFKAGSTTFRSN